MSSYKAYSRGPASGRANYEARKLGYSVAKQRARLGKDRELVDEGPGVPTRIFDILQRSNYAVANTLAGGLESGGNPLSDFWAGLSGKKKTTFSDVLKNAGMDDSGLTTGLGLALDIGLDPLTYLTFGVGGGVKALGTGTKAAQRMVGASRGTRAAFKTGFDVAKGSPDITRAAQEAGEKAAQATTAQLLEKIGSKATKAKPGMDIKADLNVEAIRKLGLKNLPGDVQKWTDLAAARSGLPAEEVLERVIRGSAKLADKPGTDTAKWVSKQAEKARLAAEADTLLQHAAKAQKAEEIANQGKVVARFMGNEIGSSEKLYKVGSKLGNALGNTKLGNALNWTLRTSKHFPGYSRISLLAARGDSLSQFDELITNLKNVSAEKGLRRSDRTAITHAIENGTIDQLENPQSREFALEAQRLFREMRDDEIGWGVLKPDQVRGDDYVYHVYRNARDTPSQFVSRKSVGAETISSAQRRKFEKLSDAKALGLDPVEDIVDILAQRLHKHYEIHSRVNFIGRMSDDFGIKLPKNEKVNKKLAAALKTEGYAKAKTKLKGFEDIYLPPEANDILQRLERFTSRTPEAKFFLNMFDSVQSRYKALLTLPNPGHHIRNLTSDVWLAYMGGGVKTVAPYNRASKLTRYNLGQIPGNTPIVRVAGKSIKPQQLNAEEVMSYYKRTGAKTGFTREELGAITPERGISGRVAAAGAERLGAAMKKGAANLRQVSEYREDFVRLAHFTDAIQKFSKTAKSLDEAADLASQQVQHWHINYSDLTPWERSVGRRVALFYTWTRNNIPHMIELALTQPGKLSQVPKGKKAIHDLLGGDPDELDDPVPGQREGIPHWLREMAPVRLNGEDKDANPIYWAAETPFEELGRFLPTEAGPGALGGILPNIAGTEALRANVLGNVTPLVRTPVEIGMERTAFTGAPITDMPSYLLGQTPQLRLAAEAAQGREADRLRFFNWLSGLGVQEVTPQRRKGEFRRQEDIIQSLMRNR